MTPQDKHQRAIQLYQQGQFEEAACLLNEVRREEETSERWNDWASAELACQRPEAAERGFRRALALEPQNLQAELNLGILLAQLGRQAEAIPFLENGLTELDEAARAAVRRLLEECRLQAAGSAEPCERAAERPEDSQSPAVPPSGAASILPLLSAKPAAASRSSSEKPSHRQLRRQRHKRPKFSVVIPTYNRRAALESCLEALSQQTLSPNHFEVIVVDDGSTDDTESRCRNLSPSFPLIYTKQANAGLGAARRLGVERARGDYLLLINDDTIAEPRLLAEHLRVQRAHAQKRCAVLGDFRYPPAARQRALTHFLSTQPLLFPQVNLNPGLYDKNAFFIASNLSIRRDAVLAVGSFDPRFRVAEDTELGVRLKQVGYQVLYHPQALAWHEHLSFTLADLIRRARTYGETELLLLRKHPHLLGDGTGPFGRLDEAAAQQIRSSVEQQREQIAETVQALEKFEAIDFTPLFTTPSGERTAAAVVMELFSQAVPAVFWFYLCETFLEAWDKEQRAVPAVPLSTPPCQPELLA